jgi:uncharacterized protein
MNHGLPDTAIHAIRQIFRIHLQVDRAILYGSRAKGTFRNGSDIDITLTGEDLALATLLQIFHELDDLSLPYTIDLSIHRHITDPGLLDHIRRVGIAFYDRTEELATHAG